MCFFGGPKKHAADGKQRNDAKSKANKYNNTKIQIQTAEQKFSRVLTGRERERQSAAASSH